MRIPTALILFSIALIAERAYGQSETVIKVPKGETEIGIVLEMEECEPVTVEVEQCVVIPTPSPEPIATQTPVPVQTVKPSAAPTKKPPGKNRAWYEFW